MAAAKAPGTDDTGHCEVDDIEQRRESLTSSLSDDDEEEDKGAIAWVDSIPDCPVCLQQCLHPVELPCGHVFCFLCVKGVAARGRRCALCRRDIPFEYFDHPTVVKVRSDTSPTDLEDRYKWYYEGRNGWWQYDERASAQLEEAFGKGKRSCELLIAGFFYIVDIANMFQYRRTNPSRKRRIKRDRENAEKKGIAGLKLLSPEDSLDSSKHSTSTTDVCGTDNACGDEDVDGTGQNPESDEVNAISDTLNSSLHLDPSS